MQTLNIILALSLALMIAIHAYRVYRHRLLKQELKRVRKERDEAKNQIWRLS